MNLGPVAIELLLLAVVAACGGPREGDDAGECSDGADNDRDGYFDCQDNDCWNSSDCGGGTGETGAGDSGAADSGAGDSGAGDSGATDSGATDSGAGDSGATDGGATDGGATDGGATDGGATDGGATDGGTTDGGTTDGGTTGGTDTLFESLDTYQLTLQVDWYFSKLIGLEDCSLTYEGSGNRQDYSADTIWFYGSYTLTATTCTDHDIVSSGFPWYDPILGEAWQGFVFDASRLSLEEWFTDDRQADAGYSASWWMYEMGATFYEDTGYASHFESYTDTTGYFTVSYDLEIIFNP